MPSSMLVQDYMVPVASSVELGMSLASAANLLRSAGLACVPVLEAGTLCGVLYERDLQVAQELGVSPHDAHLNDLPLHDAYITSPDASLMHVARAMAMQQSACAVVQRGQHVVGLLPWQAALVALVDRALPDLVSEELGPSQVRSLILSEHASIRRLLRRVELAAKRIVATQVPQESDLQAAYEAAHELCATMTTHFEHEETLLAPALEALDAWGKIRADQMRADHAEQGLVLQSYLTALERLSRSEQTGKVLAALIQQLVESLRGDMRAEEEGVLRADLLRDDPGAVVVECG
jgi:iron-sulfur cluster repair protein YtfE (RIC family)